MRTRVTKYEKDCKSRCKSRYKRQYEIIKSLQDLKVVTRDDCVACFYRHPVRSNKDESDLYATTTALIPPAELLALVTTSKSNEKSFSHLFPKAPS